MDYNDLFENLDMSFGEDLLWGFGAFIAIVALIVLAFVVVIYVFQAVALMRLAKKNDLPNAWLAWVPVGCMYLLGKLGFEVYAPAGKKNEALTWVLFGLAAASLVVGSGLSFIVEIGITVFVTWAYYNIFAKINPKNCVLFTILTAIFSVGGIILFFNSKRFVSGTESNEVKEEKVSDKEETTEENKPKYCSYCGNKLNKTSKFCGKCGNKI